MFWSHSARQTSLPVPLALVHLTHVALPDQLLKLQLLIRDFPFAEDASSLLVKKENQTGYHISLSFIRTHTNADECTSSAWTPNAPIHNAKQEVVLEEPLQIEGTIEKSLHVRDKCNTGSTNMIHTNIILFPNTESLIKTKQSLHKQQLVCT